MQNDPYATPVAGNYSSPNSGNSAITQGVMQQLAGTKPWVRLISVMMFIGAGLLLVLALVMGLMGGAIASASKNPMFSGGMGIVIAVVYALMALLYLYPAVKLWKYATCIGNLLNSGTLIDLETALSQQRSFWKFVGVITLVILCLYGAIIVIAMVAGGIGAMSGRH